MQTCTNSIALFQLTSYHSSDLESKADWVPLVRWWALKRWLPISRLQVDGFRDLFNKWKAADAKLEQGNGVKRLPRLGELDARFKVAMRGDTGDALRCTLHTVHDIDAKDLLNDKYYTFVKLLEAAKDEVGKDGRKEDGKLGVANPDAGNVREYQRKERRLTENKQNLAADVYEHKGELGLTPSVKTYMKFMEMLPARAEELLAAAETDGVADTQLRNKWLFIVSGGSGAILDAVERLEKTEGGVSPMKLKSLLTAAKKTGEDSLHEKVAQLGQDKGERASELLNQWEDFFTEFYHDLALMDARKRVEESICLRRELCAKCECLRMSIGAQHRQSHSSSPFQRNVLFYIYRKPFSSKLSLYLRLSTKLFPTYSLNFLSTARRTQTVSRSPIYS